MTVMTLALVQKQPAALRVVIGKHLAETSLARYL